MLTKANLSASQMLEELKKTIKMVRINYRPTEAYYSKSITLLVNNNTCSVRFEESRLNLYSISVKSWLSSLEKRFEACYVICDFHQCVFLSLPKNLIGTKN